MHLVCCGRYQGIKTHGLYSIYSPVKENLKSVNALKYKVNRNYLLNVLMLWEQTKGVINMVTQERLLGGDGS